METHYFIRRFPRLLPSAFTSCHSRNEPDILNSSTPITKTPQQNAKPHKPFSRIHSDSRLNHPTQRKPIKNDPNTKDVEQRVHAKSKMNMKMKNSFSSYSGLFSSEEYETLCSFSTRSSESFRMMKLAENKNSVGRCSSEVSVRSIGSIFAELSQKSQTVIENGCENRASSCENRELSKKIAKTDDKSEPHNCKIEETFEVPGMPAEIYYKRNKNRGTRKSTNSCRRNRRMKQGRNRGGVRKGEHNGDIGLCSIVEKTSSDPYSDFRTSIVEMMVENQIFGAQDLEKLLHCLLSLNSPHYHNVIVDVFSEICQTLFDD